MGSDHRLADRAPLAVMLMAVERAAEGCVHPISEEKRRPVVVCICGSGVFWDEIQRQRRKLSLQGKIVLGPEVNAKDKDNPVGKEDKNRLDALHFHKIDLADEVLVVDIDKAKPEVEPHTGDSTKREMAYARQCGLPVYLLSDSIRSADS